MNKYQIAANVKRTKLDGFHGKMKAKLQKLIFGGYYFGRATITIDCNGQGNVQTFRTICFGTDWDIQNYSFETISKGEIVK